MNMIQHLINSYTKVFLGTFLICFCLVIPSGNSNAQNSPDFGIISKTDIETSLYLQEKGAEAVVLFDYGSAKMVYNGGIKIEFTRHVRIKIFKPSGYSQANIQIPWTTEDRIIKIKACTHNVQNNLQVRTDVDKKQFYVEKVTLYNNVTRFTFPNVREGSVIEYEYTLLQDEIRNFHPFQFQRSIPVRYADYEAVIPGYFNYTINLNRGKLLKQEHTTVKGYFSTQYTDFDVYEWSGTFIPAFQAEPLMPESDEYHVGVDFALEDVTFPGQTIEISPTYAKLTQKLLEYDLIGNQLDNAFLFSKKVKGILKGNESQAEKLHKIYSHIQHRMQWNGYDQLFPDVSLMKAYQEQSASNAEINLMLVGMLRIAGIMADPVILSTRDNGKLNHYVAIAGKLNYLICVAKIDGKDVLLDATDKFRPEGMLPFKCLNGQGWVLNLLNGRWINLLNEEKFITQENYDLTMDQNGVLKGKADIRFYGYNALEQRRLLKNEGLKSFNETDNFQNGHIEATNFKFEDIDSLNLPVHVTFDVTFKHLVQSTGKFSFFNPFINLFCDFVNPWVKDDRSFPIDKGCPTLDNFNCKIHFPAGFEIKEMPKPGRVIMLGDAARFISGASFSENTLIVTGSINVTKTWFETTEYPIFREFYTQVNKKCHEMILMNNLSTN
jgi:hypothetical protein